MTLNNGGVVFTPEPDFYGVASYNYTVSDGALSAEGVVTITLSPTKDAPVATTDSVGGVEDVVLTIPVATLLANDRDADGDPLVIVGVSGAVGGLVELTGAQIVFVPTANFNGEARFTYALSDGEFVVNGAVAVNIAAINDTPTAVADIAQTSKNVALSVDVLANDVDLENQPLSVTVVTPAAHGIASIVDGRVRYEPALGFSGVEVLRYTITDGNLTAEADLTIRVKGICGDSAVDSDETCDDGNVVALDGCSATCDAETCGDGIRNNRAPSGPSAAYVEYVISCANSRALTLTINGVALSLPTDGTCTCAVGIKRYDLTAAQVALLRAGDNTISVAANGSLAWVNLVATNPTTQTTTTTTIFDRNGPPGANDRNPNMCTAGYLANATATITANFGFQDIEQCDDGNVVANDGCSSTCVLECGDGVVQAHEACDDHNRSDNDGCSASCTLECGDGVKQPQEQCDDGNDADPADGCHACRLPACGDGIKHAWEACDDGNIVAGDGCRSDCRGTEVCGDGLIDYATESCEDGNTDPNDGCAACQMACPAEVAPRIISGTLSCHTNAPVTGRKVAVDAAGGMYAVMRCGTEIYTVSTGDGGATWSAPMGMFAGVANITEVAIEGGPRGVVYAAALAAGHTYFTRSLDHGATWSAVEDLGPQTDGEVSLEALGEMVFVAVNNGRMVVYRNANLGAAGAWQSVNFAMIQGFFEVMADKMTGNIVVASTAPEIHARVSSDSAVSFDAEFRASLEAMYTDFAVGNGVLYTAGTGTASYYLDKVDLATKQASTVLGLPLVALNQVRTLDSSPRGDVFVATQLNTGAVQIDRYRRATNSIAPTDARLVGQGTAPAIAVNACGESAVYLYTNGTSVYAGVVSY